MLGAAPARTTGHPVTYRIVVKRRLCIVAVIFLLAGAVVNVAVAWGCSVWSCYTGAAASSEPATEWPRPVPNDWPTPHDKMRNNGFGVERFLVSWENARTPSDATQRWYCNIQVTQAGWPLRTLEGMQWLDGRLFRIDERHSWSIDFETWSIEHWWNFLPLKPMWPGFAVNTLFYAALLWLQFAMRRWNRVQRGLCPKCAYPMGESEVCSECGRELPNRAEVAT